MGSFVAVVVAFAVSLMLLLLLPTLARTHLAHGQWEAPTIRELVMRSFYSIVAIVVVVGAAAVAVILVIGLVECYCCC